MSALQAFKGIPLPPAKFVNWTKEHIDRPLQRFIRKSAINAYKKMTGSKRKRSPRRTRSNKRKRRGHATYSHARSGKSKTVRPRRGGRRRKVTLKKRVGNLEKYAVQMASKTVRIRDYHQAEVAEHKAGYKELHVWHPVFYETYTTNLKYFRAGGSEDVNVNNIGLNGSIKFTNRYFACKGRNNGHLPVKVTVYWFMSKGNHNQTVAGMMVQGDSALGIGATGADNVLIYPSDYPNIRSQWKCLKTDKVKLQAGDEFNSVLKSNSAISWNPKIRDDVTPANPTNMKGTIVCLIRTEGVIAHGVSATANVSSGDGTIDLQLTRNFVIRYPSDVKFKYIQTSATESGLTGGAEVAGPTVADNVDTL